MNISEAQKRRRIVPIPMIRKLSKPFNTKDFWGLRTLKITPIPSPTTDFTPSTPTTINYITVEPEKLDLEHNNKIVLEG